MPMVITELALKHSPAEPFWRTWVKNKHPELNNVCTEHKFGKGQFIPVVDNRGWDKIEVALMDYVMERLI